MSGDGLWAPPPAERSPATASDGPRDGDVVITRQRSPRMYVMSQYPGLAQITTTSRETVLDVARRFAQRVQVDVWIVEESRATRVDRHRPAVLPR